jgi:hypothetical protein
MPVVICWFRMRWKLLPAPPEGSGIGGVSKIFALRWPMRRKALVVLEIWPSNFRSNLSLKFLKGWEM